MVSLFRAQQEHTKLSKKKKKIIYQTKDYYVQFINKILLNKCGKSYYQIVNKLPFIENLKAKGSVFYVIFS